MLQVFEVWEENVLVIKILKYGEESQGGVDPSLSVVFDTPRRSRLFVLLLSYKYHFSLDFQFLLIPFPFFLDVSLAVRS